MASYTLCTSPLCLARLNKPHVPIAHCPRQDLGVNSIASAREALYGGSMRMEARTNAAQAEGNVHDMLAYEKRPW